MLSAVYCSIGDHQNITFQIPTLLKYIIIFLLSKLMKLLLNYKGIDKIMLNVQSYQGIVKFIEQNFFLKMSKWALHYIDSDGDQISLDSELDFQTMIETVGKDHIKIYIRDKDEDDTYHEEEPIIQNQEVPSKNYGLVEKMLSSVYKAVEHTDKIEEVISQMNFKPQEILEPKEQVIIQQPKEEVKNKESQAQIRYGQVGGWGKCREMWKKKMEEKMARFIDERIQSLMPCIIKKVEDKLRDEKPQPIKLEGTKHEVKCNGCAMNPIIGIRYKCTKCPLFNLCATCEISINHEHNMIKMKKVEEELQEQFKPEFSGKHMPFGNSYSFPNHPFKIGSPPPMQIPPMPFGFQQPQMGRSPFGIPPPPPPVMPLYGPYYNPFTRKQECPFKQRKHHHSDSSSDTRFKLTKKCFKMSRFFGGQPKDYEAFVMKNMDKKIDQLCTIYISQNPYAKISRENIEHTQKNLKKLSFYFNEQSSKFKKIVNQNPAASFKQLVKLVSSKQEKTEIKKEQPQIKKEEPKIEIKVEKPKQQIKIEKVETKITEPQIIPSSPMVHIMKKPPVDSKKRNECVLTMKDLFGSEDIYEYINFYNANSHLETEEIIQLYIEKLSEGKQYDSY